MAQSPEQMLQTMISNLPDKTGKSLAEWKTALSEAGLTAHKEIMAFLKGDHGVSHGYANTIAHLYRQEAEGGAGEDDLVAAQYAGGKAGLRPIYERLAKTVQGFGKDVELAPKKTYVSLRRAKQFGLIQPSTKTRVDVGINLKGKDAGDRLETSGSFNAMVTHRVRLSGPDDVDDELVGWLREAYEQAG